MTVPAVSSSSPLLLLLVVLLLAAAIPSSDAFFFGNNEDEEQIKSKMKEAKVRTEIQNLDLSVINSGTSDPQEVSVEYGVDISFPMHYNGVSTNYEWLEHNLDSSIRTPRKYKDMPIQPLGNKQQEYDEFLQSCVDSFGSKGQRCVTNERERIAMSLRQPQSMTNYTDIGFKKIRAPPEVFSLIKKFWDENKERHAPEQWGTGNTYTNNWQSPTYMVSVENSGLRGGGPRLKKQIWNAARDTLQEWTGQELTDCSLYGIRIYTEGSILATHVDRLPLVSSAIINVAQDVDEPWPIEVYGHDGKATNVTMEPGDMVLYESHSVLHGRPFPLKGRYYANIFIHFEPVGHTLRHNEKAQLDARDVHTKYKEATARGVGGHEVDQHHVDEHSDLPPYIIPGTPEEANWRRNHPTGKRSKQSSFSTGTTPAHHAAQTGDLDKIKFYVEQDKSVIKKTDSNGWTPLHEGARSGHKEIVQYLYESGADINARTNGGAGGTVMWWAKKELGSDHEMIGYLESLGAIEIGPDL